MNKTMKWAVVMMALVAGTAGAEERREEHAAVYGGQGWSVLSGQTAGGGANVLTAQLGYPGLSLGFLHGLAPNIDLGFRIAVNYSYEGLVTALYPGIKGEAQMRIRLLDTGRFSLGLNLGAGAFGYFDRFGDAVAGVSIPLGLSFGIPVASSFVAHLSLDAPIFVTFGLTGGLTFPILIGGGLEYFIDRSFAVTFDVKLGPALNPTGFRYGSRADLEFQALIGIAYKL